MDKIIRLKVASMLLFWFGVVAQLITTFLIVWQYYSKGYSEFVTPFDNNILGNIWNFSYGGLGHFIHIVAAYWLSKGRKKGIVLGLAISLYEIIAFLVPVISPEVYTPDGFAIRVLFAFIIFLMIYGIKELPRLRSENWRPWKNPKISDKPKEL